MGGQRCDPQVQSQPHTNTPCQALTRSSLCLYQGEAGRRKQLLKKMGDYQASWFLDMDDDDLEDYESDEGEDADQKVHTQRLYGDYIYI